MLRRTLIAVALTAGLAGCGERAQRSTLPRASLPVVPAHTDRPLNDDDAFAVGTAAAMASYQCRVGSPSVPEARARTLVRGLIRVAKASPDDLGHLYGVPGTTPREGLRRTVRDLEQGGCAPAIAAEARAAYDALPPR